MTAIQDSNINACFLTNYDPEWKLTDAEKQKMSSSPVCINLSYLLAPLAKGSYDIFPLLISSPST